MVIDEEVNAPHEEEIPGMPGTSLHDPLTYDPTQGEGTPAWQEAVRRQRELNDKLQQNAQQRRN